MITIISNNTVNSLSKTPGICFYSNAVLSNLSTTRTIFLRYYLEEYNKELKSTTLFLN